MRLKTLLLAVTFLPTAFQNISLAEEVKLKFNNVNVEVRGKQTTEQSKCKKYLNGNVNAKINVLKICTDECNLGNGISCLELGKYFVSKEKFKKAEFYFRKSCYLNEPRGCTNLATLYYHGIDGIKQDYQEAIKYYEKACDLEEPTACHNLGLIYLHGKGVGKDLRKAVKSLKEACNLGLSPACEDLSKAFKKLKKRKKYYITPANLQKSIHKCMSGNRNICVDIGNYFISEEDYTEAKRFFLKACYMGDPLGCNNLGLMYFYGYGVKQDFRKAYNLFKKACDKGEAVSCNNIGSFYYFGYGVKKDYDKAMKYYKKACDMGSSLACKNLAIMYQYGYGTVVDEDKATKIYKRGCKQSNKGGSYRCEEVIHFK
ncbi:MAG: hypothetical protein DSY66_02815 [Persephonella sp.]|nr:MAG: hypothetical protein DSY66_02815 [Persephonella sp.]